MLLVEVGKALGEASSDGMAGGAVVVVVVGGRREGGGGAGDISAGRRERRFDGRDGMGMWGELRAEVERSNDAVQAPS